MFKEITGFIQSIPLLSADVWTNWPIDSNCSESKFILADQDDLFQMFLCLLHTKFTHERVTCRWCLSVRVFNLGYHRTYRPVGTAQTAERPKRCKVSAYVTELHRGECVAWIGQCTVWRHTCRAVQLSAGHVPSLRIGAGAHLLGSAS